LDRARQSWRPLLTGAPCRVVSQADAALCSVDLLDTTLHDGAQAVSLRAVDGGVLTLATRAYATTGEARLIYWDLESSDIVHTIGVGHSPIGLALDVITQSVVI
jgi:hypothetical protein